MTTTFYTGNATAAGIRLALTNGNGVYVGEDAVVGSSDNFVFTATGTNTSIDIDGDLFGDTGGISFAGPASSKLYIGAQGAIGANLDTGVALDVTGTDLTAENRGLIKGWHGIEVDGASSVYFTNYGTIRSQHLAIEVEGTATGTTQIVNYGTVTSAFSNANLVRALGDNTQVILNLGVMNGQIDLGGGADTYIGTGEKAMDAGLYALIFELQASVRLGAMVDGGDGNDMLVGGKYVDYFLGGAGKDTIFGNGGNDNLMAGLNADTVTGGAGADDFVFNTYLDSQMAGYDKIMDFSRSQKDQMDLSQVDANGSTQSDDAFRFIGTKAFSGKAGEVRYEFYGGGDTIVYANIDTDKTAEMKIFLEGKVAFHSGDFLL